MRWFRLGCLRLYGLIFKSRVERDIDEEMQFHLRMLAAQDGGAAPDDAARNMARRFGRIDVIKEYCRDIKGGGLLDTLISDLRYGLRSLLRDPGFAAIAIVTLALGIGATSSMFSVVKAVLIRPLPFKDADQLVQISTVSRARKVQSDWVEYADMLDWSRQNQSFVSVGAQAFDIETLVGRDRPEALYGASVTSDAFPTLGVQPALGRNFLESEDQPGGKHAIILSFGLWQREFSSDPHVIGRHIEMTGTQRDSRPANDFEIVGVMPAGFNFPLDIPSQVNLETRQMAFWVPFRLGRTVAGRQNRTCRVIARLKPGVSIAQAQADLDAVAARLEKEYPDTNTGRGVKLVPFGDHVFGDSRAAMLILFAATGLVLLIACANIANLLIARGTGRTRETAIKLALGAARVRLVRQQMTESLLLSSLGGVAGLLLARSTLGVILRIAPQEIPRLNETKIDSVVLAFTFGLSILAGLIFSILPALSATRRAVNESLQDSGARTGGNPAQSRLRDTLIVAEVALAVLLTIGAALLTKSFFRLTSVDTGYRADHVFTAVLVPYPSRYRDFDSQVRFFKSVLRNVSAVPGVVSAGAVDGVPMGGNTTGAYVRIEGRPLVSLGEDRPATEVFAGTPDYLQTMGIALEKGRYLNEQDGASDSHLTVINQKAAQQFWPDSDPIGKRIEFNDRGGRETWHTVVGVVQNTRDQALDKPVLAAAYVPLEDGLHAPNFLVARTSGSPSYLNEAIRDAVASVDKDQPILVETSMQNLVDDSVAGRRFSMLMLAAFSALAFVLSAVGIYGLISYSVAQQTREIGIRSALGARPSALLFLVLSRGLKLSLVGVAIGAIAAFGLTRLLSSLLFQVRPADPVVFLGVCLAFTATAALASAMPARRALSVDPMTALRCD